TSSRIHSRRQMILRYSLISTYLPPLRGRVWVRPAGAHGTGVVADAPVWACRRRTTPEAAAAKANRYQRLTTFEVMLAEALTATNATAQPRNPAPMPRPNVPCSEAPPA